MEWFSCSAVKTSDNLQWHHPIGEHYLPLHTPALWYSYCWLPYSGHGATNISGFKRIVWFSSSFQFSLVLWSELVWDLQYSWELCVILLYPGMCTCRVPQPCFGGYPLGINLTCDCFHGHLHAPMLQILCMKSKASMWCLLQDLGCASLSNFLVGVV